MHRHPFRRAFVALILALACAVLFAPAAGAQSTPGQGAGGPILVVTDGSATFGRYYAEMLRAEGLNEFTVSDTGALTPQTLAGYQVVLLAEVGLSDAGASALGGWVAGGGNLIAMRPSARLAGLLGLGADQGDLTEGYIQVASSGPGAGITGATMQFHGTADRWSTAGATTVATLYSNATTPTSNPAVTLQSVGSAGGQAAAFTYDLARSVVYTRQGNPDWVNQDRDGLPPVRSNDLFYGGTQADWVNLDKVHIPQADEQQRLLANLITQMNLDRAPLPRFWYLPRGEKAAVVMTGDDHNGGGTVGQFNKFKAAGPAGCSVVDWQCVRGTSYMYTGSITRQQAAALQADGFELALHFYTGCDNLNATELTARWIEQQDAFRAAYPEVAALRTNRTHCIAWNEWVTDPIVERSRGVRLDTNYYYWPGSWMLSKPGMFTGSGMPMRFADRDGALIDVYQAATQLTDEWGGTEPQPLGVDSHIAALLDRAVGPEGYYGVFTANMHTHHPNHAGADAIVAAALARDVPVVSAAQMLDWIDGRESSSFQGLTASGGEVRFTLARDSRARGLEAMLPAGGAYGPLTALRRDGAPVSATSRTVKGIEYVVFDAVPGSYVASYPGGGTPLPTGGEPPAPSATGTRPNPPRTGASDRSNLRAKVMKHRVRTTRRGIARLTVRCPRGETDCLTEIRLRHRGKVIARRTVMIEAGETTKVKLRLTRRARRLLARSGSLKARAVLRVTDGEKTPATSKTRIQLLAPGRR